ncbi:homoserine O-succinyltransferase MetX [Pseudomarimonas arenosa]|uniref:Homoserine O-succinyltransferase n=1 Tax=Pseudomarimonas arenosa TaxID=2774145 RepID=A0AAW3ZID5_9GAMM|nr:homoserine O-succinyltransferase [Pseudomarimonas arenosa]MBD8524994.1 homoserine O-succinyltransferase [Pseudomarimonas arenosa]
MSLTDCSTATAELDSDCRSATALPIAQRFILAIDLPMRHAGQRRVFLRVEVVGSPQSPAVWVAGGISAGQHVLRNALDVSEGWWQSLADQRGALDPGRYRLLACDWVGAEGDIDAPIDTADQADAIALALDALGIARLHAFVGASYGGMVGLQFAARHAARLKRLVVLSAADRPNPFASAFRALQRQVVALGQLQCADELGLALARQLAMLSYRTPEEFAERFAGPVALEHGRARCSAEEYLQVCGQRYVQRWNSTAFLRLSESIDLHQINPGDVAVPTTLFAVEQDWLAPAEQICALRDALPNAAGCEVIASKYGHDAFLKEPARVDAVLTRAFES